MEMEFGSDLYYSDTFLYKDNQLHCEQIKVDDIRTALQQQCFPSSPFFLYSKAQIRNNVLRYKKAIAGRRFPVVLNFSMKSNSNPTILQELKDLGCNLTLVSGMELKLALGLKFDPSKLIFNGNGKMEWELEMAVRDKVLLNIDSLFNLRQTIRVGQKLGTTSKVLLRINPGIQLDVHRHVGTSSSDTKFGVDDSEMDTVIALLKETRGIQLVGLHCHLGSTITNTDAYRQSIQVLNQLLLRLRREGFSEMKILNIGGGLGIPYTKHAQRTASIKSMDPTVVSMIEDLISQEDIEQGCDLIRETFEDFKAERISQHSFINVMQNSAIRTQSWQHILEKMKTKNNVPTPNDLMNSVADLLDENTTVIVEPGRSLIGDAGVLVCTVLGCSSSSSKNFLNIDGAMTEVIRPSLYGAYHHIDLTDLTSGGPPHLFDVVGPVCESGDFLGKDRILCTPREGDGLVVFDAGAYCSSMASNYNLRLRPAEVMVDGDQWSLIRRPDTYDDLVRPFVTDLKYHNIHV